MNRRFKYQIHDELVFEIDPLELFELLGIKITGRPLKPGELQVLSPGKVSNHFRKLAKSKDIEEIPFMEDGIWKLHA